MPTSDNNRSRAADPKLGEKHPHDFTMKLYSITWQRGPRAGGSRVGFPILWMACGDMPVIYLATPLLASYSSFLTLSSTTKI